MKTEVGTGVTQPRGRPETADEGRGEQGPSAGASEGSVALLVLCFKPLVFRTVRE